MSFYQAIYIRVKYKRIYGTWIPIIYNMVEMIVAILDINGVTAIFLQCFLVMVDERHRLSVNRICTKNRETSDIVCPSTVCVRKIGITILLYLLLASSSDHSCWDEAN